MGTYWLEAKNAYGSVITRPVDVVIAAPPVITQQPAAPAGLKVGDPLTLTAEVSGGTPIYYQWVKDGIPGRWSVAGAAVFARMFFIPVISNELPVQTRLQPSW
ncbi:MAG: hypothetical protein EBR18_07700 [Betaproteobacteria bacterium]|nr:hypothetical protein [Betaproteobacteria bacterium]